MSSTNKKSAKRKQAKIQKRKQAIKAKKHQTNQIKIKQASLLKQRNMQRDLAKHGVVELAEKLSNFKNSTSNEKLELSNKDVMQGMMDLVNMVGPLHGAVQVLHTLVDENEVTLTDEDKEIVVEFDKATVKLTEDVDAVVTLIQEANKEPEDYLDLLIDHVNSSAVLVEETLPRVNEQLFGSSETKLKIDQYVTEHILDNEDNIGFGLRMHNQRMSQVYNKYKTQAPIEPEIVTIQDSEDSSSDPTTC